MPSVCNKIVAESAVSVEISDLDFIEMKYFLNPRDSHSRSDMYDARTFIFIGKKVFDFDKSIPMN